MGKIKSKMIRRTTNNLIEKGVEFGENFEDNKKALGNSMPSKKIRNQIAGLAAKMKKQERIKKQAVKKI